MVFINEKYFNPTPTFAEFDFHSDIAKILKAIDQKYHTHLRTLESEFQKEREKLKKRNKELEEETYALAGSVEMYKKKYADSIKKYQEVSKRYADIVGMATKHGDKDEANKCISLGRTSLKKGNWSHAESMFRKAVKLNPDLYIKVSMLMKDLDVKKKAAEAAKAKKHFEEQRRANEKAAADDKAKQEAEKKAKDDKARQEAENDAKDGTAKQEADKKTQNEEYSEVTRIIQSTKKCLDREAAFIIMNLNDAHPKKLIRDQNWPELRQQVKAEFRRISKLIHPDKCGHRNATVAFQALENANRAINAFIEFEENNKNDWV